MPLSDLKRNLLILENMLSAEIIMRYIPIFVTKIIEDE